MIHPFSILAIVLIILYIIALVNLPPEESYLFYNASGVLLFKMSNLKELKFAPLESSGNNYLSWIVNVEQHLESMGILETLNENNNCSEQEKAIASIFLYKHIDESLESAYFMIEDPSVLWKKLKDRYDINYQEAIVIYEKIKLKMLVDALIRIPEILIIDLVTWIISLVFLEYIGIMFSTTNNSQKKRKRE